MKKADGISGTNKSGQSQASFTQVHVINWFFVCYDDETSCNSIVNHVFDCCEFLPA